MESRVHVPGQNAGWDTGQAKPTDDIKPMCTVPLTHKLLRQLNKWGHYCPNDTLLLTVCDFYPEEFHVSTLSYKWGKRGPRRVKGITEITQMGTPQQWAFLFLCGTAKHEQVKRFHPEYQTFSGSPAKCKSCTDVHFKSTWDCSFPLAPKDLSLSVCMVQSLLEALVCLSLSVCMLCESSRSLRMCKLC